MPSFTNCPQCSTKYRTAGMPAFKRLRCKKCQGIFVVPEDDFPLVYARYVLGAIFILWLPGYAFIKALFPQTLPFARALAHSLGTTEKNLDTIERVALSLGMSIALVPIVGLLLNYTPWGIRLTPIVLSLTTLTSAFATTAIAREYQIRIKQDASRILIPASQKP